MAQAAEFASLLILMPVFVGGFGVFGLAAVTLLASGVGLLAGTIILRPKAGAGLAAMFILRRTDLGIVRSRLTKSGIGSSRR